MTLRFMQLCGLAVWLAFWLAFVASAAAQVEPSAHVESCPGVDADELTRLLTIELHTLGATARLQELHVLCHGERVSVDARAEAQKPVHLELTALPGERGALTRLLALRISELLATPAEPLTAAPPPLPPAPPPEAEPQKLALEREATRAQPHTQGALELAIVTRRLGSPSAWLTGVGLAHALPLFARISLRSDLGVEAGKAQLSLADVALRQLTVGMALSWSALTRHVDPSVGLGFRGAFSWLRAEDVSQGHQGRSLAAPWAGPFASTHLTFHGHSRFGALVGLEAGYVVVPVEGLLDHTRSLFAIEGLWLCAQLGAGYRF
jgi:hypothetical protein